MLQGIGQYWQSITSFLAYNTTSNTTTNITHNITSNTSEPTYQQLNWAFSNFSDNFANLSFSAQQKAIQFLSRLSNYSNLTPDEQKNLEQEAKQSEINYGLSMQQWLLVLSASGILLALGFKYLNKSRSLQNLEVASSDEEGFLETTDSELQDTIKKLKSVVSNDEDNFDASNFNELSEALESQVNYLKEMELKRTEKFSPSKQIEEDLERTLGLIAELTNLQKIQTQCLSLQTELFNKLCKESERFKNEDGLRESSSQQISKINAQIQNLEQGFAELNTLNSNAELNSDVNSLSTIVLQGNAKGVSQQSTREFKATILELNQIMYQRSKYNLYEQILKQQEIQEQLSVLSKLVDTNVEPGKENKDNVIEKLSELLGNFVISSSHDLPLNAARSIPFSSGISTTYLLQLKQEQARSQVADLKDGKEEPEQSPNPLLDHKP